MVALHFHVLTSCGHHKFMDNSQVLMRGEGEESNDTFGFCDGACILTYGEVGCRHQLGMVPIYNSWPGIHTLDKVKGAHHLCQYCKYKSKTTNLVC